jgi:exopolysaccharide production protein ExoQ
MGPVMPPQLALLLTTIFVLFLFWRDVKERPPITGALWIPLLWMLILGSRGPSEWLFGFGSSYETQTEGSPLDAAVYFSLPFVGLVVLMRRRVSLSTVLSRNPWWLAFLAYCAIAILWSDFPFVALKRWVKVLGHPVMVLIIATEPDPREAVVRLMKRAAYVLVPFSIMLIKYYPTLGRGYSSWTGEAFYTGVTLNKNALGMLCLLLGFFFVWHFLIVLRRKRDIARRHELLLIVAFLYMIQWLVFMANSATALMALVVGISILLLLGLPFVNTRYVAGYLLLVLMVLFSADFVFGLSDLLLQALGRDPTLTGRVQLWDTLLKFGVNPILGAGFESFWLGARAEAIQAMFRWRPNQAHNGYLETYLNLGLIGVILLAIWILATFRRASHTLLTDFDVGRFQMGLLASVLVYNYTEASFRALHLIYFGFYLIALNYPRAESVLRESRTSNVGTMQRTTSTHDKRVKMITPMSH